jgi:sec-independent protein translocase protein TatA
MFGLNPMELLIVGGVAILLFGSRLPSVAKSLGQSMNAFKKGMHELQEDVSTSGSSSKSSGSSRYHEIDDRDESTAPKFEPPAREPKLEDQSGTV